MLNAQIPGRLEENTAKNVEIFLISTKAISFRFSCLSRGEFQTQRDLKYHLPDLLERQGKEKPKCHRE